MTPSLDLLHSNLRSVGVGRIHSAPLGPRVLLFLTAILVITLVGCGGGASTSQTSSNQPAPVSISFQPAPAASILLNQSAQLTAVVKNDSSNYGVDWCIAASGSACGVSNCGPDICGSLSALHSASGDTVNYFPPTKLKGNQENVTIVAFATADHTKNVVAPISVVGFGGSFKGTYVFQAKGSALDPRTQTASSYQIAGAVNLDGNGGIALAGFNGQMIGGELTSSIPSGFVSAHITGGSYSVSADGRGTLTLNTDKKNIGLNGNVTFSVVFLSSSEALLAQVDGSASTSGTMDMQTSKAALSGGYAFVAGGSDAGNSPMAIGGIFNVDQPNGGISGSGSEADISSFGTVQNCPAPSGLFGTISSPDPFGMIQLTLNPCFSSSPLQFVGYIADHNRIYLVEADTNSSSGTGYSTGGIALSQGSATGTFAAAMAGTYVFEISGSDSSMSPLSLSSAGIFVPGATGNFTGNEDEFTIGGIAISDGMTGAYTADSTGRVDALATFNTAANASLSTPEYVLYLSGNGKPAAALVVDATAGAVGSGIAYPQGLPAVFSGDYGIDAISLAEISNLASGLTGQLSANNSSNTVSGYVDTTGVSSAQLDGTFVLPSVDGRFNGVLSAADASGTGLPASITVDYFTVDAKGGIFIETDSANVLLGNYAVRTPVCNGCQ